MIGLWKEPKCSLLAQAKIDAMQLKESVKKQNMQKCSKGWKDGRWHSGLLHRAQSRNILASKIRAETAANKLFFRLSYFSSFVSQGTRSLLGMLNIFAGLVWLTQNKSGKCAWVVYGLYGLQLVPRSEIVYICTESDQWPNGTFLCFWQIESVPDLIFYTIRRRDIVLHAWNYPGVENFSRTDKLFRNAYSFSIPLVATVSSSTCSKLVTLLQSDMKGELPFQVCAFVCV